MEEAPSTGRNSRRGIGALFRCCGGGRVSPPPEEEAAMRVVERLPVPTLSLADLRGKVGSLADIMGWNGPTSPRLSTAIQALQEVSQRRIDEAGREVLLTYTGSLRIWVSGEDPDSPTEFVATPVQREVDCATFDPDELAGLQPEQIQPKIESLGGDVVSLLVKRADFNEKQWFFSRQTAVEFCVALGVIAPGEKYAVHEKLSIVFPEAGKPQFIFRRDSMPVNRISGTTVTWEPANPLGRRLQHLSSPRPE